MGNKCYQFDLDVTGCNIQGIISEETEECFHLTDATKYIPGQSKRRKFEASDGICRLFKSQVLCYYQISKLETE